MRREHSDYHKEYYDSEKKSKRFLVFFVLLFFFVIFFLFAFSGKMGVTGNIMTGNLMTGNVVKTFDENNSFLISFETNIPEISLKGEYSKIYLDVLSNGGLTLGGKYISLDQTLNSLFLEDFSGEIKFEENFIELFSGKVSRISINGVPISSENNKEMKFSLDANTQYNELRFGEDINVKKLSFVSYGKINTGSDVFFLNGDTLSLENIYGSFSIKENKLYFSGFVTSLSVEGKDKKISIAR